mmetsp:Transcript_24905/g.56215  ORF Transcript_24905/g.56215 Transcript_24905/m.56215 type:complete len:204 (-) Transcript_24905:221-832(-)
MPGSSVSITKNNPLDARILETLDAAASDVIASVDPVALNSSFHLSANDMVSMEPPASVMIFSHRRRKEISSQAMQRSGESNEIPCGHVLCAFSLNDNILSSLPSISSTIKYPVAFIAGATFSRADSTDMGLSDEKRDVHVFANSVVLALPPNLCKTNAHLRIKASTSQLGQRSSEDRDIPWGQVLFVVAFSLSTGAMFPISCF